MNSQAGATKRYGQAPFGRQTISLRKNRVNGEQFPQYEGEFFYVESCDLPCRVSFNTDGDSQSVGLSSGFQLNAPFSGLTLFHDDYNNSILSNLPYVLTVYISRFPRAFNQYVDPTVQLPMPYNVNVISSGCDVNFPLFPRLRFVSLAGAVFVGNAVSPGLAYVEVLFYDKNGLLIRGPDNLISNGVMYVNPGPFFGRYFEPITRVAGVDYVVNISTGKIPMPEQAASVKLYVRFSGGAPATITPQIALTVS